MDDEVLMDLVTEAFPIVVFTKQLENKKEGSWKSWSVKSHPMERDILIPWFRYEITENRVEGDKFIINGTHKRCAVFQRA